MGVGVTWHTWGHTVRSGWKERRRERETVRAWGPAFIGGERWVVTLVTLISLISLHSLSTMFRALQVSEEAEENGNSDNKKAK